MEASIHRLNAHALSKGFTLVELMVALAISSIVIASMLSAFLFFSKTSLSMSNYYDMSQQSRNFLQYFARDAREAEEIEWKSDSMFILTSKGTNIIYTYDSLLKTVSRQNTGHASVILARNVSDLEFRAYSLLGNQLPINEDLAAASENTKIIQAFGNIEIKTTTLADTTSPLVSAHYLLRNKPVAAP